MTVALLWILVTISSAGHSYGQVTVVERFVKQTECEKVRNELFRMDKSPGYNSDANHKSRCIQAEIVVVK